jgi:hypothetical protein
VLLLVDHATSCVPLCTLNLAWLPQRADRIQPQPQTPWAFGLGVGLASHPAAAASQEPPAPPNPTQPQPPTPTPNPNPNTTPTPARRDPVVFACANPNPEIDPELARATRPDVIVCTGRSDFPNQINNVGGPAPGVLNTRAAWASLRGWAGLAGWQQRSTRGLPPACCCARHACVWCRQRVQPAPGRAAGTPPAGAGSVAEPCLCGCTRCCRCAPSRTSSGARWTAGQSGSWLELATCAAPRFADRRISFWTDGGKQAERTAARTQCMLLLRQPSIRLLHSAPDCPRIVCPCSTPSQHLN